MRRLLFLTILVGCAAPNLPKTNLTPSQDGQLSARVMVETSPDGRFSIRIVPQWQGEGFHTQAFSNGWIDHYEVSLRAYGFGPFVNDSVAFGGTPNFTGVPPFDNMVAIVKGHNTAHDVDPSAVVAGVVSASNLGGSITIDRNSTPKALVLDSLMSSNQPRLAAKMNLASLDSFLATLPAGTFPLFVQPTSIASAIVALNSDPTTATVQLPADGAANSSYVFSPASIGGTVTFNGLFSGDSASAAFATGPQAKVNDPSSGTASVSLATGTYNVPNVVPGGPWKVGLDTTSMSTQATHLYAATAPATQNVSVSNGGAPTANFTVNLTWPTPTLTNLSVASISPIAKALPQTITATGTNFHPAHSKIQFTQTIGAATLVSEAPCTFVDNTQCTFGTPPGTGGGSNNSRIRLSDGTLDLNNSGTPVATAAVTVGDSYGTTGTGSELTLVAGDNGHVIHRDKDGVIQMGTSWNSLSGPAPFTISGGVAIAGVNAMAYDPNHDTLYLVVSNILREITNVSTTPSAHSPVQVLAGVGAGITLAGSVSLGTKGFAYVTIPSSNAVQVIDLDSTNISTLAANAAGSIPTPLLNNPQGIVFKTLSSENHLFVTQSNHTLIDLNLTTSSALLVAGANGSTGSADGLGTSATFNLPTGITTDPYENLYVVDSGTGNLRKVTLTPSGAMVTTMGNVTGAVSVLYAQPNLASPTNGNQGALLVGNSGGQLKRLE